MCTAHGKSYRGCENCHKTDIVLKVVNFSGNILLVPCQTYGLHKKVHTYTYIHADLKCRHSLHIILGT